MGSHRGISLMWYWFSDSRHRETEKSTTKDEKVMEASPISGLASHGENVINSL